MTSRLLAQTHQIFLKDILLALILILLSEEGVLLKLLCMLLEIVSCFTDCWSYFQILIPRHLVVRILAGAIDSGYMLLQRRHGIILIGAGPLSVFHLDEAGGGGKGGDFDGRHQYCRCAGGQVAVD